MNLRKLVKEVSVKIGLKKIPHITVSVDAHYAETKRGRIGIAPILVSCLNEQQMRSVIAHMGYHCRNYWRCLCLHILFSTALTLLPVIIFVVMLPTLVTGLPSLARFDVMVPVIVVLVALSFCVSFLILRWKQRWDELRADTLAVGVAGKKSIRQVFRLTYGTPEKHGLIGRMKGLFYSHPSIQKRLENIAYAPSKQRNSSVKYFDKHMKKTNSNQEVYEATLVITVFGVFFSLMLNKFNMEFLPSKAYSDVLAEILLSAIVVGAFTVICLFFVSCYLRSLIHAGKPKTSGEGNHRFLWFLVRVVAVGAIPLGVFYGEVSVLYWRFPAAFLYAYNIVLSLGYFFIWVIFYLLEEWHSRRENIK